MEAMESHLPDVADFPKETSLAMEKEMLGVYITDHPLNNFAEMIKKIATVTSEDLNHAGEESEMAGAVSQGKIYDGMKVVMAGMVSSKRTLITKSNKMMAFVVLEVYTEYQRWWYFLTSMRSALIIFREIRS